MISFTRRNMALNELERKLFLELLDDYENDLSHLGCSEYGLSKTPENYSFLKNVIEYCFPNPTEPISWLDEEMNGEVITDHLHGDVGSVFSYLRNKAGLYDE